MATTKKRRKKKKRRAKPSPQVLLQREHRRTIRAVFRNAGFAQVPGVSDKEFCYKGQASDFDDVFVCQNVIILAEYTTTQASGISSHLKAKKIVYDLIQADTGHFVEFFESQFPKFYQLRDQIYASDQCQVVILYCSRYSIPDGTKSKIPKIKYLDYPVLRYFKSLTDAIKLSSRYELLSFLGLSPEDIGEDVLSSSPKSSDSFEGSVLPESHSNYEKGYKVVSFYISPEMLLSRLYVLRRDGWGDESGVYQRMISSPKIRAIRRYLHAHKRVFINNIIITLPATTKLLNSEGNTISAASLNKTSAVTISVPRGFNVIGIVDGQHRVYSYHEGGIHDDVIAKLRKKQNLLVTGLIYPEQATASEKVKFEAKLFLEINSTQTSAKSDLKQAIGLILNPYSSESIAKAVLNRLNKSGPLEDVFESHFYDQGKLKTSSIVSFALMPIVKTSGTDSFYSIWTKPEKAKLLDRSDENLLEEYIEFCVTGINTFFGAVRANVDKDRWTTDRNEERRLLTVVIVNGLIICLRKMIENKKIAKFATYKKRLSEIGGFRFGAYKSSQYNRMAESLYNRFFSPKKRK